MLHNLFCFDKLSPTKLETPIAYVTKEYNQNAMNNPQYFTFPHAYLKDFTTDVFMYFGVPEKDAHQAAEVLSKADLRGIDSHGVARLRTYVDMFKIGRI